MKHLDNVWTIILAGGKGTRMKSKDQNKVTLEIGGKPMIVRTVENLHNTGINNIVIVVGFAKESVMNLLRNKVQFAYQKKRLGTGHALKVGLENVTNARDVLVLYGDDSYVYTPDILNNLIELHTLSHAEMTFLTLIVDNPAGLGRIIRDTQDNVVGIVEEKDATPEQKKIHEINPACYIFSIDFLKKNIDKIDKSPVTGEYYLTSLMEMAFQQNVVIKTLKIEGLSWRGINSPHELSLANKTFTENNI